MFRALYEYILALASPLKVLDWFEYQIPVDGQALTTYDARDFWSKSIGLSWIFYIIGFILESILLYFALLFLQTSDTDFSSFDFLMLSNINYISSLKVTFIFNGIKLLLFPVILMIGNTYKEIVLKMISGLIFRDENISKTSFKEMIAVSNSSNLFSCIPFLGIVIKDIMSFVLLYRSLRWRLHWGRAQAFISLVIPQLLLFTFVFLFIFLSIIAFI